MPDKNLLEDVAHDIKKQISSTEDLRMETALFYQSVFSKLKQSYASVRRETDSTVGAQTIMPGMTEPDPGVDRKTPLGRARSLARSTRGHRR